MRGAKKAGNVFEPGTNNVKPSSEEDLGNVNI
jgi:hypothetical protein